MGSRWAFTLVELLVAVAVLSLGLVAVLRALQTCVSALAQARDTLRATDVLRELLAQTEIELRTHPGDLPPSLRGRMPAEAGRPSLPWERRVRGGEADSAGGAGPCATREFALVHLTVGRETQADRWSLVSGLRPEPVGDGRKRSVARGP